MARQSIVAAAAALAALAALQAYVLHYIFSYGALHGAIPYDDCAVVLRSLQNLNALAHAHTIGELLANARNLSIHAPISDFQTMAGLMAAGGAAWGAYALNVIWPAIALLALATTRSARSLKFYLLAAALLLLQPVTMNALWWLKSDWHGGVLFAAGIFVLFDAAEYSTGARGKILGSALLALALLCKMTTVYQPPLALATFAVFEIYEAYKGKALASRAHAINFARMRWRLWALCAAIMVGSYAAFFYYSREHLIEYITWGLGPIWRDNLTIGQRAAFYLWGHNAWGMLPVEFLVVAAAALLTAALRRAAAHLALGAALAAIIAMFALPLILAPTSGESYAAMAFGAVIGASMALLRVLQTHLPRFGVAIGALTVAATAPFVPLSFTERYDIADAAVHNSIEEHDGVQKRMAADIAASRPANPPQILYTYDNLLAPVPNMSITYFRLTGDFAESSRIDDMAPANLARLQAADFAVALAPHPGGKAPYLSKLWPLSGDPAAADRWLAANQRFRLLKRYPVREGEVRLYQAISPPPAATLIPE